MTTTNRYDYIKNRLVAHWVQEVEASVIQVDLTDWNDCDAEDIGPGIRCGWSWPVLAEGVEGFTVLICPELITTTTETLPDPTLDEYLGVVEYVVDRHMVIAARDLDADPWLRHETVIDHLSTEHPNALELLQYVQLQAAS